MDDERQRVDRLAGQEDVELLQRPRLVSGVFVIQARIAFRAALERVEEVHDELG